jgi:predicted MFS family arabinose efflux permease
VCSGVELVGQSLVAGCARRVAPASGRARVGNERAPSRIDAVGALLLGGGLAALLVALTEGPARGWGSGAVVGSFAAAAVLLAGLGAWSRRTPHPLVDLAVLRRPVVLSANVVSFVLGYALFGTFFLVPTLVEGDRAGVGYGFGVGAIGAGLFLLPAAIGQIVAGPLAGRVARAREPRWPLVSGMALLAAGAVILAVGAGSKAAVLGGMLALGLGFGSSLTPSSTLVTQAVSARESGVASALNSVVRRVGGGVGGQVGAALLAAITVAHGSDPSRAAFTTAFAVTAAVGALGLLCAAVMPGDGAARV